MCIRDSNDCVHIVNTALIFNLCDNFNILIAEAVNKVTKSSNIIVIADK